MPNTRTRRVGLAEVPQVPEDLRRPDLFFNRELSLIEYNRRVLDEAANDRHPLLERIRSLYFFSTNIYEFFMIRVSGLREQVAAALGELSPDRMTATEQLAAIREKLLPLLHRQSQLLCDELLPLEQLIAANLDHLFPGLHVVESYPFQVIRDADIEIAEDEASDLSLSVGQALTERRFGSVVCLFIDASMPEQIRMLLMQKFEITPSDVYTVEGLLALGSLMELYSLDRPDLKYPPFQPRVPAPLHQGEEIFAAIARHDWLLHHPYDSFTPVVDLLQAAVRDPNVLAIKQTLYRVGGSHAPVVDALLAAAQEGKQVAVLVELKARFDEENNIEWARALERAGAHVAYGLLGLKTHAKLLLIVRKDHDGLRRYVHLGTGNYNA